MASKMFVKSGTEVVVPAGTYFLGDPCYIISHDAGWMELLDSCGYFDGSPVGEVHGCEVLAFGTKYGDGVYFDQLGRAFGVDAGLIGLVPVQPWEHEVRKALGDGLGKLVVFTEDSTCTSEDGLLTFGPVAVINTDPDDDEYDDED
jgi:hypothetical protein